MNRHTQKSRQLPRQAAVTLLACAGLLLTAGAAAKSYPDKPVTFVVPWAPGGTSDQLARLFAAEISRDLNQTVVVENVAGAGTTLGTEKVANGAADGYQILMSTATTTINDSLRKSLRYKTSDLTPVITLAAMPMVLMVNTESPIKTVQDLLDRARKSPPLSYGSAGPGSVGQLTMESLQQKAGIKLTHIPFKGSAPSVNAMVGGHVDIAADTIMLAKPLIAGNRVRAIALSTPTRSNALPDVPTVGESGVPGFATSAWWGIAVKTGTPEAIIQQLNTAFKKALQKPDIQNKLTGDGFQIIGDSPAEAQKFFNEDIGIMGEAIRASGVTVE
jgi:tripartite-type tricarboxylate transporter receptor subunit TctC